MKLEFSKYHGSGNDFIIIDNRTGLVDENDFETIKFLCDRRMGIGADGVMLLKKHPDHSFEMVYYNADGFKGSMCGNGGRCIAAFAFQLKLASEKFAFVCSDGLHYAEIIDQSTVRLKMNSVSEIEKGDGYYFLDTGSPHYVVFVEDLAKINVFEEGRKIRYNSRFSNAGTNVNFVMKKENRWYVRTYERGVEQETLSCGTGVVASAISIAEHTGERMTDFQLNTLGSQLNVTFKRTKNVYEDIWLIGPVQFVFAGKIDATAIESFRKISRWKM